MAYNDRNALTDIAQEFTIAIEPDPDGVVRPTLEINYSDYNINIDRKIQLTRQQAEELRMWLNAYSEYSQKEVENKYHTGN